MASICLDKGVGHKDILCPKFCVIYSISQYAHGYCFAVLCCGYTLTDFPISIRLTSLALWQSNDCPSASKATLMNMDKYFMWIDYERLHNHNKAKHNKTVCIFLGIYCIWQCLLCYRQVETSENETKSGRRINDKISVLPLILWKLTRIIIKF